jgi:Bacterial Ig-like domain (group 3)
MTPGIFALERRVLLATDVWTGASSSSWSDDGNWSLGAPPGTTDVADFTDSGNGGSLLAVTLDEPASIAGLTIDSSWTGTLSLQNALVLLSTSQVSNGTIDFSSVTTGSTTVTGSLTNVGTLTYSGSTQLEWDAAGTFTNKGTLNLAAATTFALANGGTLTNSGVIADSIAGDGFALNGGSTLTNQQSGMFDFQADSSFGFSSTPGTLDNLGTVKKTAGTGTSALNVVFNNENGVIAATSGTISVDSAAGGAISGGTFNIGQGATLDLTGGATVSYSGSYTGTGLGTVSLNSGTLGIGSGGATFDFNPGLFQWTGGTINTSTGNLTNTGTISLAGASGASEVLEGSGVLTNQGTINQTGLAFLDIDSPATLDNTTGTFDFQADSGISEDQTGGTFTNGGSLEKTAGTGSSIVNNGITFSNTGTVSVQSGTLNLEDGGQSIISGTLAAGTWTVAAGTTLDLGGSITTLATTVTLQGPGAVFSALAPLNTISTAGDLDIAGGGSFTTAGNLDNAGTISLGPGALTVTGGYTQASTGTFDEGIGGITPATQFGQINVTSAATLNGTLDIRLLNSFEPSLEQTFAIVSSHSESGKFSTVTTPTISTSVTFQPPSYAAAGVSLATIKNSSTTVTSSVNPATVGQSITFTATVQAIAPQTGTPTGQVTFMDGTTALQTVTLAGGTAVYKTSSLALGPHSITVDYSGDPNFAASDSSVLNQAVLYESQTTLSSSLNPSVSGQSVTLTATVSSKVSGVGTPAGSVTFMLGSTPLQTVTLSNGTATYPTTSLKTGMASLTAVYSGNNSFATSTSNTVSQTVNQDTCTAAGSASSTPSPPVVGQQVTLTATVTADAPGSGTPTGGTVVFKYGSQSLGVGPLQQGTISIQTSALPPGTDSVTVQYQGDPNFKQSPAANFNVTIDKGSTTTTLTSAGTPSVYGQQVNFTATVSAVSPATGTPAGEVTLFYGTVNLGFASIISGHAIISTVQLPTGTDAVTAVYDGNAQFNSSPASASVNQTVGQDGSHTSLVSSGSPSAFGEPVTFTATVSPASPGGGTPAGIVTFQDSSTTLGQAMLTGGTASFTTSALAIGSHSITAVYAGNTNFTGSPSSAIGQTIGVVGTKTVVMSSAPTAVFGQSVTLTATVVPTSGQGAPGGTVTFTDGASVLGSASLNNGVATLVTSALALGSQSISASYAGAPNFMASSSAAITESVTHDGTVAILKSSSNPGYVHQFVTITVSVIPIAPGSGIPTGTVVFKEGKKKLLTTTLTDGMASLSTKKLAQGANKITVLYAGNVDFTPSTSAVLREVIKNPPPRKKSKK